MTHKTEEDIKSDVAIYAGVGGGLLADQWLTKHRTVCYVERDPFCVKSLKARIRDGLLCDAPIWDDANTFDGKAWRGKVDRVVAGFPCKPFAIGGKRLGAADPRNGWPALYRIIGEVQPSEVFLENSPNLLSPQHKRTQPAYIWTILDNLSEAGYDAEWGCLSAGGMGASHLRSRLWILAYTRGQRRPELLRGNPERSGKANKQTRGDKTTPLGTMSSRISQIEQRLGYAGVCRSNDGLADRVDRLRTAGQGQVSRVAAEAYRRLSR